MAIACFGEYVADFTTWFTGGEKEKTERLAKRSTLFLIAALALELICLVNTNTISGMLIGSLSEKAEEADAKSTTAITNSSTALSQAGDALTKAGKAEEFLGKAESEAKNAKGASTDALTTARDARKEADSFEQDIAFAKKQVVGLDKQVKGTQAEADEIRDAIAWRHVSAKDAETIRHAIPASLRGYKIEVRHLLSDPGAAKYASEIADALRPVLDVDGTSGICQDGEQYPKVSVYM